MCPPHPPPPTPQPPTPPYYFNFQTKQGLTVSVSNTKDVAFTEYSEIIRTRNFTVFNVCATTFGQFTATFHFLLLHRGNRSFHVGLSEKVRYLTLDLLKSSLL